jgi:peptidoglycan/LPS O-acetylase OafA/YrhL
MSTALKVVLIVYGAVLLLMGLVGIILPEQISEMFGVEEVNDNIIYLAMAVSVFSLAVGIWILIAARDLLRNIIWVKFSITVAAFSAVLLAYSSIKGYVEFIQVLPAIILWIIFIVLFLVFYPWREARAGE